MKTKTTTSAGCFLVRRRDDKYQLLLIHKDWGSGNAGWVPPKGAIQLGESVEEAAIRETKEETGHKVAKIIKFLKVNHNEFQIEDQIIKKDIHWFLALAGDEKQEELRLTGHEKKTETDIRWFDLDLDIAVAELKFDDEKQICREVISFLEKDYEKRK